MKIDPADRSEWLEADGLGGFASGTTWGVRTRRYHALLLAARTPPTGRVVLVNGIEAWVTTARGPIALSSQSYAPGLIHPDGWRRIESFEIDPWPRWSFRLDDGAVIEHELLVPKGAPAVVLSWRLRGAEATRLHVRPLISGRDYHATHHENGSFRFDPEGDGAGRLVYRPYPDLPAIAARHNGSYEQSPDWYRSFFYEEELKRGLDFVEDLASPGIFHFDLNQGEATLILSAEGIDGVSLENLIASSVVGDAAPDSTAVVLDRLRERERSRRAGLPGLEQKRPTIGRVAAGGSTGRQAHRGAAQGPGLSALSQRLDRAADAYIVRRGSGSTIVAGYPWFTDWGRDTFIALRGLCIATGRLETAREILLAWASAVSEGMLPNLFPDGTSTPEYNSVDASLWYIIAVHDYIEAARASGMTTAPQDRVRLGSAVEAILDGYTRGTRFGIRADHDGLLAAGVPGVQLTWMDAKIGDWVVTPRIGKPVEVEALWLNALRIGAMFGPRYTRLFEQGLESFRTRFWNAAGECLYDVVDVDNRPGSVDPTFRPNQILSVGGLPHALLEGERARLVVDAVERRLWTPAGLRSLAEGEPGYARRYEGGPRERDASYHQGTVWPWLLGPFVEGWVRTRGGGASARAQARARFLEPLLGGLDAAGIGHISEIADAEAPHTPRGCPFQAWSLGEALRLDRTVLAAPQAAIERLRRGAVAPPPPGPAPA